MDFGNSTVEVVDDVAFSGKEIVAVGRFGGSVLGIPSESGVFLAKFSTDGSLAWARQLGPTGVLAEDVTIDGNGNIVVVGSYNSMVPLSLGDSAVSKCGGLPINSFDYNAFVARFDATGVCEWAIGFGHDYAQVEANGVVTDQNGNIYVIGDFADAFVDIGGEVLTNAAGAPGQADIFLAKYDAAGTYQGASQYGAANSSEWGRGIALLQAGGVDELVITGDYTGGEPWGLGGACNDIAYLPFGGAFLAKLGAGASCLWSKGFDERTAGLEVAVSAQNEIVLMGITGKQADFGGGLIAFDADVNGFVAKFDGSGGQLWSMGIGTDSLDAPDMWGLYVGVEWGDMAVDGQGNVLVTGAFGGQSLLFREPGGQTPANLTRVGSDDVFLAKFAAINGQPSAFALATSDDERGEGIAVNGTTGNIAIAGSFRQSLIVGETSLDCAGSVDGFIASMGPIP